MKFILLQDNFGPESLGGAASVVFSLAKKLLELKHEVLVITTVQDKSLAGEVTYQKIRIIRLYANYPLRWQAYLSLYNPVTVNKVRQILIREKPQIVWAHNIHCFLSYHCLKVAKESGAKVILTAHDTMLFHYGKFYEFIKTGNLRVSFWEQIKRAKLTYNPFRNIFIRYYLSFVDNLYAVSNSLKLALNENGIKNVEVMYNWIDVDEWEKIPVNFKVFINEFKLTGKKIIFFVAGNSWAKGGYQTLLALKEIVKSFPDVILLVVGQENSYIKGLKKMAQSEGLENYIIFTGLLEGAKLKTAYKVSDVVVFPSVCLETFGMVNLEAMASKKPVVGTCYGGTQEIVLDNKTGYIVNPYNTQEMADKIADLLLNETKAQHFGRAGYERAKSSFCFSLKL